MKKSISLKLKAWILLSTAVLAGGTFTGCQDEVDKSNRFTFTGEVISTHLLNNPDKFSHFTYILDKAYIGNKKSGENTEGVISGRSSLLETLSTYGSYTCIAPTDPAIEEFVEKEYNRYIESVENNKLDPEKFPIIDTGIYSPEVSQLSDEKCNEIAKNHIIEAEFKTINFSYRLPKATIGFRDVYVKDSIDKGERKYFIGADEAEVIESDISTYNGTIHVINGVLNPSTKTAGDELGKCEGISIFREAIFKTGLNKLLEKSTIDEEYDGNLLSKNIFSDRKDIGSEYPAKKEYGFTLLIEPNEVFMNAEKNNYGKPITTWLELAEYAENVIGSAPGYEEEYTHPQNALFKFMAYHIIDRDLDFAVTKNGAQAGAWVMENYKSKSGFESSTHFSQSVNWSDYFETYMPYSNWTYDSEEELAKIESGDIDEGCMIKVTRCYKDEDVAEFGNRIVINKSNYPLTKEQNNHANIIVYKQEEARKLFPESLKDLKFDPVNAKIHIIDKILIYDEDLMAKNILNERMRWDAASLLPELTTSRERWRDDFMFVYIPMGITGEDDNGEVNANEKQYSKRLKGKKGFCYYMSPYPTGVGQYTSFQGDEILMDRQFDAEIRLPHVPKGDYEIRIGFSMSANRGKVQFYLNDNICGLPTNMLNEQANINRIGHFKDEGLTEEEILSKENAMRNRGYMMAPQSILVGDKQPMRVANNAFRRIIETNYKMEPKKDGYWLRAKDVTENPARTVELNIDYIEIVPQNIYGNTAIPEDRN